VMQRRVRSRHRELLCGQYIYWNRGYVLVVRHCVNLPKLSQLRNPTGALRDNLSGSRLDPGVDQLSSWYYSLTSHKYLLKVKF
jgi:hypothetical protein